MRLGPFAFRPALTALAALGLLVLIGLGTWQVARLQWKTDLIARTEAMVASPPVALYDTLPAPREYRPVRVTGGFVTDRTVHVSGTWAGRPGFYVFQPFQPDQGRALILVNRGFVSAEDRQATYTLPDADALTGLVRFYQGAGLGLLDAPPDPDGLTVYDRRRATLTAPFRDLAGGSRAEDELFAPFYLDSTLPTETPRGNTTRLDFTNRHLGYAITWFGLAGGLLLVFLLMSRAPRA